MLTIHEKAKSEIGRVNSFFILSNNSVILFCFILLEFQNLVFTEVKNQTWGDEANDTAHTYIWQEVLRKVDA